MKRVANSWPYLAGVVALVAGWLAVASLPLAASEVANLVTLYCGSFAPVALAAGGAVLGWRRGYDWVSVLVCVLTAAVLIAVGNFTILTSPAGWDAVGAGMLAYTFVAHVGIVAALAMTKLNGPTKTPKSS
ncbi:hypothetical protein [Propionicimonas sp.]|uniref:hypothetical protein n=1 Tax=Propionicimonas sp. TaxID=1955623 RepID=UPI0017D4C0E1|nr:hypothetical protein [Propionicimonas sp.]MBU3976930.1 hypothetical protein [Actinomycetota bacterium]MBA3020501.1 hypothetical protein [Propionicimonas sp.]MBU3986675.1 hypothetical protein [Actinomycetota bacterium]MBU4007173.1 hypothetical protein [Actinomycetota bacterium]MBU4064926.1 hypothetical protein [Actinomycetota bacterium]